MIPKHWEDRYRLFTRWDQGVLWDIEGFDSTKGEQIAAQVAARFSAPQVIDAFCGLGIVSIMCALAGKSVIAADVSQARLSCAIANAGVYGVSHLITFRGCEAADAIGLAPNAGVYLDPPWGGWSKIEQARDLSDLQYDPTCLVRRCRQEGREFMLCVPVGIDGEAYKPDHVYVDPMFDQPYCRHLYWERK